MKHFACLAFGLLTFSVAKAEFIHFVFHSPPGELIGNGVDRDIWYFPSTSNTFRPVIGGFNNDGVPNFVSLFAIPFGNSHDTVDAAFSTHRLGFPMTAGSYLDAERAAFATQGHPGMDISFGGRGSNTITGSFVVNEVSYHHETSGWVLDSFDATFEQHSGGAPLALTGRITYSSVPEPSSMLAIGAGLTVLSVRRRRKTV